MATKAEIAAQIAKLKKEHDALPDDDDLEVEVERDGTRTKLRGKHARAHLKKLGLDDDDQGDGKEGDQGDGKEGDESEEPDAEPPSGHKFFR